MQLDTAKITQDARTLGAKDADSSTHLVCLLDRGFDIARLPYGAMLKQRLKAARHKLAADSPFHTQLPNAQGTRLSLLVADPGQSAFERLTLARKTIAAQRQPAPEILTLACFGLKAGDAGTHLRGAAGGGAGRRFPAAAVQKRTGQVPAAANHIHIWSCRQERIRPHVRLRQRQQPRALAHGAAAERTHARKLPQAGPDAGARIRLEDRISRDIKNCNAKGAGAFLAVAQGSPDPDAGILHLRYTPKPQSRHPGRAALGSIPSPKKKSAKDALALVGKGICFDTGGTNLKNAKYMHGMHEDMQGSAVALGTLLALTELKAQFPVDCWLALAQNHIGPKAYKQNDIVKAANGKTIEVMHTDAEGRMVLADTLYLASQAKPKLLIDYATLTGACIGALSTRLSGALTNRPTLVPTLIRAGEDSGERVWPFPLYDDFKKALKSNVADIKQCTLENDADQILAAVF